MTLIDDLNQYQYIGFPFEAFGWPGPIKQRLVGSNDGLNWDVLKEYEWGWRDTDMMKIGNRYYICATDDCVHYTDDFETFTQIPVKSGYKMSWAPEWFKDSDGTIYMFYAASDSTSVYFKMFCRTFDPQTLTWGKPEEVIFENNNSSRIDPNVHLINGKYYMWIANQQTHNVELYTSDKLKGVYSQVSTNMPQRTMQAGFNRNEAPEMLNVGGTYYLYTDPWTDGVTDENKRMLYRSSSTDMIDWSSMTKCQCDFGMRHFTPLDIKENENNDSQILPPNIEFWNGDVNTFYQTNLNNYFVTNGFIQQMNNSNNPFIEQITIKLDDISKVEINRGAYLQFLNNAEALINWIPKLVEEYRLTDYDFTCVPPKIPEDIFFNQSAVNNFWNWVKTCLSWVVKQLEQVS